MHSKRGQIGLPVTDPICDNIININILKRLRILLNWTTCKPLYQPEISGGENMQIKNTSLFRDNYDVMSTWQHDKYTLGVSQCWVLLQLLKSLPHPLTKPNILTKPSMNMIGHMTREMPWASFFTTGALGSTPGKILGTRQTKRLMTTAIPQHSFRRVGFFFRIKNLRTNKRWIK